MCEAVQMLREHASDYAPHIFAVMSQYRTLKVLKKKRRCLCALILLSRGEMSTSALGRNSKYNQTAFR